jgi:peptidylprolyl isomerase
MKLAVLALLAGVAVTSAAQTAPKAAAKPVAHTAASGMVLPKDVPRVRGIVKTAFSLRYQDIKLGTGAEAEPNKMYHVLYTGYLASNGYKFDSSEDHRIPLRDKDGKIEIGPDGKPRLGDPQPLGFPQGFGRLIPGFDQGFNGMKIGGKRRLFIPWQLAYGARGRPGPDPAHPGIPAKADLIFDVELVDVTDMQMPQGHPGMGAMPHPGAPMPPGHPAVTPGTPATAAPAPDVAKPATPQPKQ